MNREVLNKVELDIILRGADLGSIEVQKDKIVPLREGKLAKTPFGEFIGKTFDCNSLLAINYYGHFKLSSGIVKAVESVKDLFKGVRSIKADIIHFNSIRTETAKEVSNDDTLFIQYVELKKYLLDLRFGEDLKKTAHRRAKIRAENP